jgi:PIN domain nuclease of toxin-antitoxin system
VSSGALDASALLALLNQEPGADQTAAAIAAGAAMSAVNLSEVVAKLREQGVPAAAIRAAIDPLGLDVVPFDADQAYAAGDLRVETRQAGLSLGDRACLALAQRDHVPALTADRSWERLQVGVAIQLIR